MSIHFSRVIGTGTGKSGKKIPIKKEEEPDPMLYIFALQDRKL